MSDLREEILRDYKKTYQRPTTQAMVMLEVCLARMEKDFYEQHEDGEDFKCVREIEGVKFYSKGYLEAREIISKEKGFDECLDSLSVLRDKIKEKLYQIGCADEIKTSQGMENPWSPSGVALLKLIEEEINHMFACCCGKEEK